MKQIFKVALIVVFLIVLAGIANALYLFFKQHKSLDKVKPDFVITATYLQKEFEDNETAAVTKYVNMIIEVSGTIVSVKTGEGNVLNVSLKTGSDFSAVICTFPATSDISQFTDGKEVTIRGECSGFLMDVLLNNCVLVK
jgi:hypothetical protein